MRGGAEVKLRGEGFVKQVGFKPGWKCEGDMDEQSGESEEKAIEAGKGESGIEKLVPEWGWRWMCLYMCPDNLIFNQMAFDLDVWLAGSSWHYLGYIWISRS